MTATLTEQLHQLQNNLSKMEVSLRAIASAVVWINGDRQIEWCNLAFEELVNQSLSAILGESLTSVLPLTQAEHPVSPELYPDAQVLRQSYEPTEYEFNRGDRTFTLEITGRYYSDTAILTLTEITLSSSAHNASLSLLKATLESTADGILVINRDCNVPVYNQKFLQMWSVPYELIRPGTGEHRLKFLANQTIDPEGFIKRVFEYWHSPESVGLDLIELKDGRIFERYTQPQWNDNEIVGRVWSFRDITQAKKVESRLRESEERLRTLINATPDVICFKDGEGRWLESNQANLECLGLKGIEYQEKTDREIAELSPFYQKALLVCEQTDEQAWQARTTQRVEEIIPHPDGTSSILDMIKVPLFYADGKRKGLVVLGRDITARKQAEGQYRDLVEAANCIVLRWDTTGKIKFMNGYGQHLFGYTAEELMGQNVVGTIVPESETSGRDLQSLMIDICQNPENHLLNENENLCKNGDRLWIAWSNKPILDIQGNLVEILSIGTNATERKQVEAALRESEAKFRSIVENANDLIYLINPQGVVTYISPNLRQIMGYEPQEMEGKSFCDFIHPEDLALCIEAVQGVFKTGQPHAGIECRVRHKNGTWHWHVANSAVSQDAQGNRILIGIARDISDRKRTEEALRASETRLNTILNSAIASIARFRYYGDDRLHPEYYSSGCELIFGYSAQTLINQPEVLYARIPAEELASVHALTFANIYAGKPTKFEHRYLHPDGSWRWISVTFTSMYDETAACWIVTGIATDVTDRKRVEEALRQSEERFRSLYETTQFPVILADEKGPFDCNQAAEKLFGYTCQQISQMHTADLSPPLQPNGQDSRQLADQHITRAFQQGVHCFEWVHRRADGSTFPAEIWVTAVQVRDRRFIQALIHDLSERKQVEAALAERAALAAFRADVGSALARNDSLPEMLQKCAEAMVKYLNASFARIWTVNSEAGLLELQASAGLYTRLNGTYSRIPLYLLREMHPYLTNQAAEDTNVVDRDWAKREGLVAFARYPLMLEDQLLGMVAMFAKSSLSSSTLEALGFAANEIALGIKRKQAEIALRKSELKYRNIFENSQVGIGRTRLSDGLFIDLNQRCAEIMGYKCADELIGKQFTPNFYADVRDRDRILEQLHQKSEMHNFEVKLRRRDGSVGWGLLSLRLNSEEDCIEFVLADISDRKRLEEKLRQSQQFLDSVIENIPLAVFVKDVTRDFRYVLINKSSEQILGFSREGAIGYSDYDLIPKSLADFYHNQDLGVVLKKTEIELTDQTLVTPNHQEICARIWKIPLCNSQGDVTHLLGIAEDITERKHQEEALQLIVEGTASTTGDEFFQSCVRYLAQVLRVRYALVSEFINETRDTARTLAVWGGEKIEENFEYSLKGTPCEQVLHKTLCYYPEGIQSAFPQDYELARIEAQSYLGMLLTDSSGQILGHLAVIDTQPMENDPGRELILRIFAARAGAELERKHADIALERRAQAESLLSSISRHFMDWDVNTAINLTLEAITPFIGAERTCIFAYPQNSQTLALTHEWCTPGISPLAYPANGGSRNTFPWFHEQILNGQVIQLASLDELPPEVQSQRYLLASQSIQSVVAVPTFHGGKAVGFLGADTVRYAKHWSLEEIRFLKLVGELIAIGRARHQAEEELRVAKEAAEAANRTKSIFLANMSHELRTPLNAILGFPKLMERDAGLTAQQREYLAIVNRSGEHLLSLIDDVLELSKIEAGRVILHPALFNLQSLLQTLEEMFQIRAQAKHLSLQFELAADLPQVAIADEGKLRQVLINLLGNAIKFTPTGQVTLRVSCFDRNLNRSLTSNSDSITLLFEVEDTGVGIDQPELNQLFQPFVQTSSGMQAKEGTGLGLVISRQFVRLMGGDIRVKSTLGEGSIFCFQIPVTLTDVALPQPTRQGLRVKGLAPNQPSYRILVVDDYSDIRDLLTHLLIAAGFETREATNGEEAIAICESWQPHLIWMDMRMPVLDGYGATAQIRAKQSLHLPPPVIIALTASAFEEQRSKILAAGCDDLVRKPFREQVIFNKMAEHLGVRYLYAESLSNQPPQTPQSFSTLEPSNLSTMPREWITQLHQFATRLNEKLILQLLSETPSESAPLAQSLQQLVAEYRFDQIIELTRPWIDSNSG